jgi:hypothetical protein
MRVLYAFTPFTPGFCGACPRVFRVFGASRLVYVMTAVIAQYLNFVVLIVQSFQKMPELKSLAPTQSEPPFLATQLIALAAFIVIGFPAARKFRPHVTPAT